MSNPTHPLGPSITSIYESFLSTLESKKTSHTHTSSKQTLKDIFQGKFSKTSGHKALRSSDESRTLKEGLIDKLSILKNASALKPQVLKVFQILKLEETSKLIDIAKNPTQTKQLFEKLTELVAKVDEAERPLFEAFIQSLEDVLISLTPPLHQTVDVFLIHPLQALSKKDACAQQIQEELKTNNLGSKNIGDLNPNEIEKIKTIFNNALLKHQKGPLTPESEHDTGSIKSDFSYEEITDSEAALLAALPKIKKKMTENLSNLKDALTLKSPNDFAAFLKAEKKSNSLFLLNPDIHTTALFPYDEHRPKPKYEDSNFYQDYVNAARASFITHHFKITDTNTRSLVGIEPQDAQGLIRAAEALAKQIADNPADTLLVQNIRDDLLYMITQSCFGAFTSTVIGYLSPICLNLIGHKLYALGLTYFHQTYSTAKTAEGKKETNSIQYHLDVAYELKYTDSFFEKFLPNLPLKEQTTLKELINTHKLDLIASIAIKGSYILKLTPKQDSLPELSIDALKTNYQLTFNEKASLL